MPPNTQLIILTDCGYQEHTMLDPYTDILQIIGRLRNEDQEAVHINNSLSRSLPITEQKAVEMIGKSKHAFDALENLRLSTNDFDINLLFQQALKTIKPYYNLLDKDGNFSHFLKDNYLDDNRVSQYYQRASDLKSAYIESGFYDIEEDRQSIEKSELERLSKRSVRYSAKMNAFMAKTLLELEDFQGTDIYKEQSEIIERLSPLIYVAYHRLGYDMLKFRRFNKRKIEKELIFLDNQDGANSFIVTDLIYNSFDLDKTYLYRDIKPKLQFIYHEAGIKRKAVAKHIEGYFEFRSFNKYSNGSSNRAYIFTDRTGNVLSNIDHK